MKSKNRKYRKNTEISQKRKYREKTRITQIMKELPILIVEIFENWWEIIECMRWPIMWSLVHDTSQNIFEITS